MNRLEDIVRNNRNSFNEKEPSEGHLERFSFMLATRLHAGNATRSIIPYLLKAAVVTLLITLSSLWTWDHYVRPNLKRKMTLSQVSPEYREAEKYYVSQVNYMENEFMRLTLTTTEQREMFEKEMASMDSVYKELQKELKVHPGDQRIIDAMIRHYQTKVEVMSYIISQLKEIKEETLNQVSHEKVIY